jgi:hypothetical protein
MVTRDSSDPFRRMTCAMARSSLVLLVCVGLTAFACGAEPEETGGEEPTGRERVEQPQRSDDCPPDWPGPWTACPEAEWVQQVAERAGYRITGDTGSALISQGHGWSFYIWGFAMAPEEIARAARRESWRRLGTVAGVEVYGDESLWRWWVTEGFVIWLHAGPRQDSRLVPFSEMESLVRASEAVPPPSR